MLWKIFKAAAGVIDCAGLAWHDDRADECGTDLTDHDLIPGLA
jgi:hypothetical protein